jgi:hypothetical protein
MGDTVEFGGWPRPPRWAWVIAGAATVAVLAGAVIAHTRQHPAVPTPGAASPAAPRTGGRQPVDLRMPPRKPARMAGQPLPRDAGLRLMLGGQRPSWLWVSTGRAEPVRGLPHRDNGYQLIRMAGGWAALPFPGNASACAGCVPRPAPVYYIANGSREARHLGSADFVAPAAASGALWLVSYGAGAAVGATTGTAQEVSVSGAALGHRRRLPLGYIVDQGTGSGLLLEPAHAEPGTVRYQLWQPGARRASRWFPNVIAASPGEIAWTPPCAARCTVHVLKLPGGLEREIPLPRRSQSSQGAFSPDGKFLALLVTARIGADGRAAASRLAVAPLAGGRLAAVPGTTVGIGNGVDFGWQAGTGRLVADVALQDAWQIAVWRPGDARLRVAVARAPAGSWPVLDPGPY